MYSHQSHTASIDLFLFNSIWCDEQLRTIRCENCVCENSTIKFLIFNFQRCFWKWRAKFFFWIFYRIASNINISHSCFSFQISDSPKNKKQKKSQSKIFFERKNNLETISLLSRVDESNGTLPETQFVLHICIAVCRYCVFMNIYSPTSEIKMSIYYTFQFLRIVYIQFERNRSE